MAQLVYYIASTLDGFIARPDGAFHEFPWDETFGAHLLATYPETFPAHLRPQPVLPEANARFGTVLMGRRTYEVGLAAGITSPYPTLRQCVVSRTLPPPQSGDITLIRDEVPARIAALKVESSRDIWLCGGAALATSLLEHGLIDEVIIKLNPVIFGAGIPLFARPQSATALALQKVERFPAGHIWLEYQVRRPTPA